MTMTTDNSNKILNAPALRFPGFSREWELHPTTDYFEFKNGLNPEANRFGRGTKFISVMDILNNRYITYDKIISSIEAKKDDLEDFGVNYGDVLFQRSSETLEDVGRANVYLDNKTALFGGFVIRGKRVGNYDPLFFRYLLSSPSVRKRIIVKGAGAQHFNIGQEGLSKVSLFVPCIDEQKRISAFMNLLDERIETQSRAIEKLQSLISGLQESILWQNHKRVSFSEIFIERNERTSVINQYEVLSSTAKGIYRQSDYFDKEVASTNNVGYKVLHKGDIVLSPQNLWLGNINYNEAFEIGMVSPSYKVFSIREQFDPVYVASILKTHRALFEYASASEQGASVVRRNLNMDAFMAICIPIPSKEIQDQVAKLFLSLNQKLKNEVQMIERFNKQKAFLLSHMFI